MPTDYRRTSTYKNKISREFIEPVRVVDDIVDWSNEMRIAGASVTTSASLVTLPADCEIFFLRHVDATDIVWIGHSDSITAGSVDAWPLRPEDPPLRIRMHAETPLYGITASGNVDLHIMGLVKR